MLAAEIWALWDGLKLPLQTNITNVVIERDANNVIKLNSFRTLKTNLITYMA